MNIIEVNGIPALLLYWAIALITAILANVALRKNNDRYISNILLIVAALPAAVFAGARYSTGTDTLYTYLPYYESIRSGTAYLGVGGRDIEIGYELLNYAIAATGSSFSVLLTVVGFATVYFILLAVKRLSHHVNPSITMWAYMMLFFPLSFNATRQMISISIFLFALSYLLDKQKIKCVIWILVATCFHKIAIVYLAVPLFHSLFERRSYRWVRVTIYILLLGLIIGFPYLQSFLSSFDALSYYANSYLRSTEAAGFSIGLFIRTVPFLLPIIFIDKNVRESDLFRLVLSIAIIGMILRTLAYVTSTNAERLSYNFLIAEPLLIGFYLQSISKYRNLIAGLVIAFTFFLSYYDYLYLGIGEVIPYIAYRVIP